MLDTLKERLKELAVLPINAFADRIRDRSRDRDAAKTAKELQAFVMVIPEMIVQIRAWMDAPETPSSLKELHGFMLTYLYHPVDFLPEERDGFFGYLDDAYVVGSIYLRTMTQMDPKAVRHLPHGESISKQLPYWLYATEQILPVETRKIEIMLEELSWGNPTSFNQMMAQQGVRMS